MSVATEYRKLSAIMFTDMVGYTALTQRNEALALELLEEHRRLLRELFPKFNGREIETTGDGFLVEFGSALQAARCAIEIQRAIATRNLSVTPERQIQLRIGIHVGDVVHKDGHVLGDGVNIAARLQPLAEPGGICISIDVARQVQHNLESRIVSVGAVELKNVKVPMEVCRIVLPWQPGSPVGAESIPARGARKNLITWGAGVVIALMLGILGWLVPQRIAQRASSKGGSAAPPTNVSPVAREKSIAVLPFSNMSADKADEYLSDGISEEIITSLWKIKGLKVPARTSCFAFKGKNDDIQKIGQQLHVGTVLEGSVRKAGNKLRVTAQLINIGDGFLLWSENYNRTLDDLLEIQAEVAAKVAEALKGQLLGEEKQVLAKHNTENAAAHRLYLQGRYQWNRRSTSSLTNAIEYFNQAIGQDPVYALAYAGLADCYVLMPYYAYLPPREPVSKGRAAAQRALELDNSLVEPRVTLAYIKGLFDLDWKSAEADFRQAIQMNSNYATAHHWFSDVLRVSGKLAEAVAQIRQAHQIDPLSPMITTALGDTLSIAGEGASAIELLKAQIELDPSFVPARNVLGRAYLREGKLHEAIKELETAAGLAGGGGNGNTLCDLGLAYARAGRTEEAQKVLQRMQDLQQAGFENRARIALVQHALGDDQQALELLDRAADDRAVSISWYQRSDFWKDLRPNPRFQALLHKMNLPDGDAQ